MQAGEARFCTEDTPFPDPEARYHLRVLADHAYARCQGIRRAEEVLLLPVYQDPAAGGAHIPGHDVHKGGLARAVFSQ
jgi:hypothetical protein